MKYMLLIYSNPETWNALSAEELEACFVEHATLVRELRASGEWVDGSPLESESARTVRIRHGVTGVTDGPYSEVKEHLAGFDIVDCATPERAAQIAARIPDARYTGVEVVPLRYDERMAQLVEG